MKNGKLFGKLNIIDLLVILAVIAAVALVAFKVLPFGGNEESVEVVEQTEPNIRFTVLCEELPQTLVDNIIADLEGESCMVNNTEVSPRRIFNSGEVLDAEIVSWTAEACEKAGARDLYLTVEANAEVLDGIYTLHFQEVRLGKSYILKTLGVEIEGATVAMEKIQ